VSGGGGLAGKAVIGEPAMQGTGGAKKQIGDQNVPENRAPKSPTQQLLGTGVGNNHRTVTKTSPKMFPQIVPTDGGATDGEPAEHDAASQQEETTAGAGSAVGVVETDAVSGGGGLAGNAVVGEPVMQGIETEPTDAGPSDGEPTKLDAASPQDGGLDGPVSDKGYDENHAICELRKQEIKELLAAGGFSKKQGKQLRSELSTLVNYMA